jgi:hypothetical protein
MSPAEDQAAKKLARRLYRALKRNDQTAYIGEFDPSIPGQRTVIDGRFNLVRVAHYLLSEIPRAGTTPNVDTTCL